MNCGKQIADSPQTVFKYVSMEGAKATLLNQTIQFTHPKDLNDPFDCLPGRPRIEEVKAYLERESGCMAQTDSIASCLDQREPDHYLKIREKFSLAMSCFSTSKDNYLMWGHYAAGFKGCCLEFDSEMLLSSLGLDYYRQVDYDDARAPEKPLISKADEERFLCRKASCWWYENERRLFLSAKPDKRTYSLNGKWYRTFSPDALLSVTVGMMASEQDLKDVASLCRRFFPHTTVYKTSPDDTSFAFKATPYVSENGSA